MVNPWSLITQNLGLGTIGTMELQELQGTGSIGTIGNREHGNYRVQGRKGLQGTGSIGTIGNREYRNYRLQRKQGIVNIIGIKGTKEHKTGQGDQELGSWWIRQEQFGLEKIADHQELGIRNYREQGLQELQDLGNIDQELGAVRKRENRNMQLRKGTGY